MCVRSNTNQQIIFYLNTQKSERNDFRVHHLCVIIYRSHFASMSSMTKFFNEVGDVVEPLTLTGRTVSTSQG